MAKIENIKTGFYRLPLKEVLVDAMHGAHHVFEVVTIEVTDSDGVSGVGYTFTGGRKRRRHIRYRNPRIQGHCDR